MFLLKLLLNRLGVDKAAAFVGCSYGGMVGLAFAVLVGRTSCLKHLACTFFRNS